MQPEQELAARSTATSGQHPLVLALRLGLTVKPGDVSACNPEARLLIVNTGQPEALLLADVAHEVMHALYPGIEADREIDVLAARWLEANGYPEAARYLKAARGGLRSEAREV